MSLSKSIGEVENINFQEMVFKRWINYILKDKGIQFNDLYSDISNGIHIVHLIETLTRHEFKLKIKNPTFRSQKMENITMILKYLEDNIHLKNLNIDSSNILDKNSKYILCFIWHLIEYFSILQPLDSYFNLRKIVCSGKSIRQKFLVWLNNQWKPEKVKNINGDVQQGHLLGALVNACDEKLCSDWREWQTSDDRQKGLKLALDCSMKLGVPNLIKPTELIGKEVDEKCLMIYLSQFLIRQVRKITKLKSENEQSFESYVKTLRKSMTIDGINTEEHFVDTAFAFSVTLGTNEEIIVKLVSPTGQKNLTQDNTQNESEGTVRHSFKSVVPQETGEHTIMIYLKKSESILGSQSFPVSKINVPIDESQMDSILAFKGRGIQPTGIREGEMVNFTVEIIDPKVVPSTDLLTIIISSKKGTLIPITRQVENNCIICSYKPNLPGDFEIAISLDHHQSSSKIFPVKVSAVCLSKIVAFGPGLFRAFTDEAAVFVVETNGETGVLNFTIEGPTEAQIECKDNSDGSASVWFWPVQPGEYAVHILYDDEDISQSPFMVQVTDKNKELRPKKVKVYGAALSEGCVTIGQQAQMTVDLSHSRASMEELTVVCYDRSGRSVPVQLKSHDKSKTTVFVQPTESMKLNIFVTIQQISIPGSPFMIYVMENSLSSKIQVFGEGITSCQPGQTSQFTVDCRKLDVAAAAAASGPSTDSLSSVVAPVISLLQVYISDSNLATIPCSIQPHPDYTRHLQQYVFLASYQLPHSASTANNTHCFIELVYNNMSVFDKPFIVPCTLANNSTGPASTGTFNTAKPISLERASITSSNDDYDENDEDDEGDVRDDDEESIHHSDKSESSPPPPTVLQQQQQRLLMHHQKKQNRKKDLFSDLFLDPNADTLLNKVIPHTTSCNSSGSIQDDRSGLLPSDELPLPPAEMMAVDNSSGSAVEYYDASASNDGDVLPAPTNATTNSTTAALNYVFRPSNSNGTLLPTLYEESEENWSNKDSLLSNSDCRSSVASQRGDEADSVNTPVRNVSRKSSLNSMVLPPSSPPMHSASHDHSGTVTSKPPVPMEIMLPSQVSCGSFPLPDPPSDIEDASSDVTVRAMLQEQECSPIVDNQEQCLTLCQLPASMCTANRLTHSILPAAATNSLAKTISPLLLLPVSVSLFPMITAHGADVIMHNGSVMEDEFSNCCGDSEDLQPVTLLDTSMSPPVMPLHPGCSDCEDDDSENDVMTLPPPASPQACTKLDSCNSTLPSLDTLNIRRINSMLHHPNPHLHQHQHDFHYGVAPRLYREGPATQAVTNISEMSELTDTTSQWCDDFSHNPQTTSSTYNARNSCSQLVHEPQITINYAKGTHSISNYIDYSCHTNLDNSTSTTLPQSLLDSGPPTPATTCFATLSTHAARDTQGLNDSVHSSTPTANIATTTTMSEPPSRFPDPPSLSRESPYKPTAERHSKRQTVPNPTVDSKSGSHWESAVEMSASHTQYQPIHLSAINTSQPSDLGRDCTRFSVAHLNVLLNYTAQPLKMDNYNNNSVAVHRTLTRLPPDTTSFRIRGGHDKSSSRLSMYEEVQETQTQFPQTAALLVSATSPETVTRHKNPPRHARSQSQDQYCTGPSHIQLNHFPPLTSVLANQDLLSQQHTEPQLYTIKKPGLRRRSFSQNQEHNIKTHPRSACDKPSGPSSSNSLERIPTAMTRSMRYLSSNSGGGPQSLESQHTLVQHHTEPLLQRSVLLQPASSSRRNSATCCDLIQHNHKSSTPDVAASSEPHSFHAAPNTARIGSKEELTKSGKGMVHETDETEASGCSSSSSSSPGQDLYPNPYRGEYEGGGEPMLHSATTPPPPPPPAELDSSLTLFGEGLYTARVNTYNQFFIRTSADNTEGINISIQGPSKVDIETSRTGDGNCRVKYIPRAEGRYKLTVQMYDEHVAGSPFFIECSSGSEELKRPHKIQASLPAESKDPTVIMTTTTTANSSKHAAVPHDVAPANSIIAAPTLSVNQPPPQASVAGCGLVYAEGPGLIDALINVANCFNIYTKQVGSGGLSLSIEGPSKAVIEFKETRKGVCGVSYRVSEPGQYTCIVKFNKHHITGSPFPIMIKALNSPPVKDAPHSDRALHRPFLSDPTASGRPSHHHHHHHNNNKGSVSKPITTAAAAATTNNTVKTSSSSSHNNSNNSFYRDKRCLVKLSLPEEAVAATSSLHKFRATLHAHLTAPSGTQTTIPASQMRMAKSSGGHHLLLLEFVPLEAGIHRLYVADKHHNWHKSLPINVLERSQAQGTSASELDSILVYGRGLVCGQVGHTNLFFIEIGEAVQGALNVTVDGPSKVEITCGEYDKGFKFSYLPTVSGDYLVTIRYGGEMQIKGSPFLVSVRSASDKVSHPVPLPPPRSTSPCSRNHSQQSWCTTTTTAADYSTAPAYPSPPPPPPPCCSLISLSNTLSPHCDLLCYGAGLRTASLHCPAFFYLDASAKIKLQALSVTVTSCSSLEPCQELQVVYLSEQRFLITYRPRVLDKHRLLVKWADKHVHGSPFLVEVSEPS